MDSWLFKILHNLWIDKVRLMRESKVHIPIEETNMNERELRKDGKLEEKVMLAQVMEAMEQLPETDRAILSLICVDGMSYREASKTLDIPLGTVMSRLARARQRLYALVHGIQETGYKH